MNLVYALSRNVVRSIYDGCFRGDISGLSNVPRQGPYLLAGNHASHLDPPFLGAPLPEHIAFFARKTLWKPGFASWWLDNVEAIPVDRDGGSDVKAMKRVFSALNEGRVVILFPEGTRSPDGKLQSAKAGVGMLACRSGVPVVPARLFGTFEAFGRDGAVHFNSPVSISYAKPLLPADYDDPTVGKERYQRAADRIMAAIAAIEESKSTVI